MISPMEAEAIAATKAADAAMSFTFPAMSLYSGETKSTRYSRAVLSSSAIQTMAIERIMKHHSVRDRSKTDIFYFREITGKKS